jgi:two-component system cell cycle response regulator
LWELAPGVRPVWRHLAPMARKLPIVSYSAQPDVELETLSRSLGFASHLTAPLSPDEVRKEIARSVDGDLAVRLRGAEGALRAALGRREALAGMVREVNASLEPARIGDALVRRATGWFPVSACAVFGCDPTGKVLLLAASGVSPDIEETAGAAANWVIHHAQQLFTADLRKEPLNAPSCVAALGFPLQCPERTIGALIALDTRPSRRTPTLSAHVREYLATLLEPVAFALDNAFKLQRFEALSVTDDLTRLYNSRYLDQVLRREVKRAGRSGRPLSMLFIDLDGFKRINDTYGHLHGSQALIEAAVVIRGSARETDVVARFGGDEFAVILPDTHTEGARSVAERIRERIAAHPFLEAEGLSIHLSSSVGVATFPDSAGSAEELIRASDQAMYWVKDHGKNGIQLADGMPIDREYTETNAGGRGRAAGPTP